MTSNADEKNDAGPSRASSDPAADRTARIRYLNDRLRRFMSTGEVVLTQSILALDRNTMISVANAVRRFSDFTDTNDPYGEHDFGKVEHNGQSYFWKIDYYDKEKKQGSPDPTDPAVTTRVLTIMLAEEY